LNAVEIEEQVSKLAMEPFDPVEFPYAFLLAFGNKDTTIKKLRSGNSNASDVAGGILQRSNIHIAIAKAGEVSTKLAELKASPKTAQQKAKFILATDGDMLEAEDLSSNETIACSYPEFANKFGFFLPLAGITTVKQIRDNPVDIQATGRLNRLYVELLKENEDWATAARRPDMNHFMARLIFCFFAEDTDIFNGDNLFTATVTQMSERDSGNTHEVISELFRAMNTKVADRKSANIKLWADVFPYVNGGLFSGSTDVPRFSKMARAYLLHAGSLNWKQINPDIFGSMIQAVADDDERGELGMHYTSVPNILKVLNPLFLDDLRGQLEAAGDNARMLLNLRKRMAKIRVFDPACGSGNFLVIAYKEMRAIEAQINTRRGEEGQASEIPLTNFRGIELRDFPAEIARLALIIAEYQCDVLYRGQKLALNEFLPLDAQNWITCDNALRVDWLSVCPPIGKGVKLRGDDLFSTLLDQAEIDFENDGGETYICGNPPWVWSNELTPSQKSDMRHIFEGQLKTFGTLDYVSCWFLKVTDYIMNCVSQAALVSTNSISQGQTVPSLWPYLFRKGIEIRFAHTAFKWSNNAARNATADAVIIGLDRKSNTEKHIFTEDVSKNCKSISPYLIPNIDVIVKKESQSVSLLPAMDYGCKPIDGGHLIFSNEQYRLFVEEYPAASKFLKRLYGSDELIYNTPRFCLYLDDADLREALSNPVIEMRIGQVKEVRMASSDNGANKAARRSHQFREHRSPINSAIFIPAVSSENRQYLTPIIVNRNTNCTNRNFVLYDAPQWCVALLSSKLHRLWALTVCGKLQKRPNYSNTLGWNTFPVPPLTEKNKADLSRCAEDILLAREAHWPKTIADLYDPEAMPEDLAQAHARNDEVLERIYIGRRFKNDTERLEKLFDMYTKMTAGKGAGQGKSIKAKSKKVESLPGQLLT
jgi:hypothetical protein